jgi:hypothetical protein
MYILDGVTSVAEGQFILYTISTHHKSRNPIPSLPFILTWETIRLRLASLARRALPEFILVLDGKALALAKHELQCQSAL